MSSSVSTGASPNSVGVFADDDGVFNTQISSIFRQAYKPLSVEMIGNGLVSGKPIFSSWDNIHHWAKRPDLPPTPGAANAAHSHWRWGKVAASSILGASHFKGLGGAGGALLDPAIPEQHLNLRLRVVIHQLRCRLGIQLALCPAPTRFRISSPTLGASRPTSKTDPH
jgi:hypothetical protein